MSGHEVVIDGDAVRKRYRRTNRGEPDREWAALVLLDEHAPGLAPRPLAREIDPPVVVMSRVTGVALEAVLTPAQTTAMIEAYRTLFAVPVQPDAPRRYAAPDDFLRDNAEWITGERTRTDVALVVRRALAAAHAWHVDLPRGLEEIRDPVAAQGDGRVDNMLWDGSRVRLIDFEYFGVGDLAFEVADLAEHISARLEGLRDSQAVIAGFDLTPAQLARAQAYRIALATFWLLMLLPGNPGHDLNPRGSDEHQAVHLLSLLAPAD